MLLTILNVISILLIIYGMYYIVFGLFAFKNYNKEVIARYEPKTKFKVLIACRNEESVIGELIESLKHEDYPKELYEICVIPNNCTDSTEAIAKSLGTRIIKCSTPAKCKGDALRCAFDELKKEEFDAYAVFDADNIVHPNFLKRMNDAVLSGCKVAQGNRDSKNPEDSWVSGSYAIYYWIQNLFFNRAHTNVNASASINGTGYIVKKEVIDNIGFETKTLTEDIEFTIKCALNNIKIGHVEDAITYDEQPVDYKTSWKQRKRWSTGANKCLKIYGIRLIKNFFKTGNILNLDMVLNNMSPSVQVFGTIIGLIMVILKLLVQIELAPLSLLSFIRLTGIHFGIITYLTGVILNIYIVKYHKRSLKEVFKGIFLFTLFILSWIPINFVSVFSRKEKWEEIKHTRIMRLKDIKKEA